MGRFINADDTEILLEDQDNLLQYNLFAYCFNNPVNMIDPYGEFAISITTFFFGGVIMMACIAMIAVVNTPSSQQSWERMCNDLARAFSGALSWASAKGKSIAQSIGDSFTRARSKPRYRTPREVHHIVAQKAPNASLARDILEYVGIGLNSPQNLYLLKRDFIGGYILIHIMVGQTLLLLVPIIKAETEANKGEIYKRH